MRMCGASLLHLLSLHHRKVIEPNSSFLVSSRHSRIPISRILFPHPFPSREASFAAPRLLAMPKGQVHQWKAFWKQQKDKRKKSELKQQKRQKVKLRVRSPFQCSICRNPRYGRKRCYLCNELDAVVELDWILAQKQMNDAKKCQKVEEGQNNTLTQMYWKKIARWLDV